MKKFSKYFMAAVMTMAMVGFVACKKDEDKKTDEPQQEYAPSTTFDILYNGHAILEGAILEYPLSAEELANDDCDVEFFVKNKSNATVQRVFMVELAEGPASMGQNAPICYGVCEPHNLPYTSGAVNLAPGIDEKPIQIHLYPSFHQGTHTGTYKITVGKGADLEDPQVCFVRFSW